MERASLRIQSTSRGASASFPSRTHPGRPPEQTQRDSPGAKPGDGRYPERCNPWKARPPLDQSQRELATSYVPLAEAIAGRVGKRLPGARDDLKSAAYFALVQAAQSFDPGRNVSFATFARHRIQGALFDLRRQIIDRRDGDRCGMTSRKPGSVETGGPVGPRAQLAREVPVGTEMETSETVERWIRRLPRPHARALRHIYIDGRSQDETAHLVGCSKTTLSRLHSQGLHWLQQDRDILLND